MSRAGLWIFLCSVTLTFVRACAATLSSNATSFCMRSRGPYTVIPGHSIQPPLAIELLDRSAISCFALHPDNHSQRSENSGDTTQKLLRREMRNDQK